MKTQLKDRTLWYDGTNQVTPEQVPHLLLSGVPVQKIVVSELDDDLIKFNLLDDVGFKTEKLENDEMPMSWNIPKKYQDIELKPYLLDRLGVLQLSTQQYSDRVNAELDQIEKRDMTMLFRTLIYVVDEMRMMNTVWGVGRGSSCASLVLFLIGLHKVDPIKYGIPLTEFYHD